MDTTRIYEPMIVRSRTLAMSEEPDDVAAPLRFSMRRVMFVVTAVCLVLGSGLWWFFSPALALIVVLAGLQLPLMVLVKRKLQNEIRDIGDGDSP